MQNETHERIHVLLVSFDQNPIHQMVQSMGVALHTLPAHRIPLLQHIADWCGIPMRVWKSYIYIYIHYILYIYILKTTSNIITYVNTYIYIYLYIYIILAACKTKLHWNSRQLLAALDPTLKDQEIAHTAVRRKQIVIDPVLSCRISNIYSWQHESIHIYESGL